MLINININIRLMIVKQHAGHIKLTKETFIIKFHDRRMDLSIFVVSYDIF